MRPSVGAYAAALVLLIAAAWLARQLVFNKDNQQVAITEPSPTVSPSPEIKPVKLLAQLNDGGSQLELDERGALSGADNLPAEYQQLLKQALTETRLTRPATLNGLGSPSAALMSGGGGKAAFAVIEPVAKVLLTDRPTLRWQVKALKDNQEIKAPQPPAPLARFRVLAKKEIEKIEQAHAQFASSHLLLGRLYAEAGLLDEAEREFRALERANPDSEVVKRWLGELNKLRR